MLMYPGLYTDIGGVVIFAFMLVTQFISNRNQTKGEPPVQMAGN